MVHYEFRLIALDGRQLGRLHFSGRSLDDAIESVGQMRPRACVELWCAGLKIRSWGACGEFSRAVERGSLH